MRILWCSNPPYVSSGYGVQTRQLLPKLKALGHEVTCVALTGLKGALLELPEYNLYPEGYMPFCNDVIESYVTEVKPDITISLVDAWVLHRWGERIPNWYPILPVDTVPVADETKGSLTGASGVISLTRQGQELLNNVNIPSTYIPHGIDTDVFKPIADTVEESKFTARQRLGLPLNVTIFLMVSDNKSCPSRKAFERQFLAFRKYLDRHPGSILLCHTEPTQARGGLDLHRLVSNLRLNSNVIFPNGLKYFLGYNDNEMNVMYNAVDVLMNCLPPSENIITDSGVKSIAEVKEGDAVWTHNGKFRKVVKTMSRDFEGELVTLKRARNSKILRLTEEHPVLVQYGKGSSWKLAKDIKVNDYVMLPKSSTTKHKRETFKFDCWKNDENLCNYHGRLFKLERRNNGYCFIHPQSKGLPQEVDMSDMLTVIAHYITEGTVGNGEVHFSIGVKKNDIQIENDLFEISQKWGINCHVRDIHRKKKQIIMSSSMLGEALIKMCKHGSHNKHFPYWVFSLPKQTVSLFIDKLWLGDGYEDKNGVSFKYTTVSATLANQLQLLLLSSGTIPALYYNDKRKSYDISYNISHRKVPSSKWFNSEAWYQITDIGREYYKGKVYNLEVEGDNSFSTEVCVVHNCTVAEGFGLPVCEIQAAGRPVICTKFLGDEEHCHAGWAVEPLGLQMTPQYVWNAIPDEDAICEAMEDVLSADLETMAIEGRKYICDNFAWNVVMEKHWKPFLDTIAIGTLDNAIDDLFK